MKRKIKIPLLCFAILGAGLWGLHSFALLMWEATLRGPFTGVTYAGIITSTPSSVLSVPPHGQLEVHELPGNTNPVVMLRSPNGKVEWARLFLPEKKWDDGKVQTFWLRELRLEKMEQRSTNAVVWISCDWEYGGKEGGLIFLDPEFGFDHFKLSW